jgi:hypothetical protein
VRRLGLIVEGHGDQKALPVLVRRITSEICGLEIPIVLEPHRLKRGLMTKEQDLSRAVELVARKVGDDGCILIVLDADDDLGCMIAPLILKMARAIRSDRRIGVVAAVREYEAWLLAGSETLAGKFGLVVTLPKIEDAESLSNPKAWLNRHMEHRYAETIDQERLTRHFDLDGARKLYSFNKLVREISHLLEP